MKRVMRVAVAGLVLGALVALPGCSSSGTAKQDPKALVGVEWTLVSADAQSGDMASFGITAKFNGAKVAGFSGVNQYAGPYTAETDGSFKTGEIAGTLMAGEPAAMKAEQVYLATLAKCDSYAVTDSKLTLSIAGKSALVFEKAKAVELPGSSWVVTGYNNGKQAVVSVALDSTMTIDFGTDGTVSGNSGVNTYNGPFTAEAKTIKMGPFATTKMAGPEELMAQETAFLTAMENGTTWSVSRDKLEIRDGGGALQVSAVAAP